jgi:hypothetical protein
MPKAGDTGPPAALNAQPVHLDDGLSASSGAETAPAPGPIAPPADPLAIAPSPAFTPDPFAAATPAPDPLAPVAGPLSTPGTTPPPATGVASPLNPATNEPAPLAHSPADQPFTMPLPPAVNLPPADTSSPTGATSANPQAPPPVPPPMMPPGFVNPNQPQ